MRHIKHALALILCLLFTMGIAMPSFASTAQTYTWDFEDIASGSLPQGFRTFQNDNGVIPDSVLPGEWADRQTGVAEVHAIPAAGLSDKGVVIPSSLVTAISGSVPATSTDRGLVLPPIRLPESSEFPIIVHMPLTVPHGTAGQPSGSIRIEVYISNEPNFTGESGSLGENLISAAFDSGISNFPIAVSISDRYAGQTVHFIVRVTTPGNMDPQAWPNNIAYLHSITVPVAPSFTVTASTGGAVSPNGPSYLPIGYSQRFTVTPENGYRVSGILLDGQPFSPPNPTSFSIENTNPGSHTLHVDFTPIVEYPFTVTAGAGGSISPSGSFVREEGSSQIFTVTPEGGYRIGSITVNGAPITPAESFTITDIREPYTIQAEFAPAPNNDGSGGSYLPSYGNRSLTHQSGVRVSGQRVHSLAVLLVNELLQSTLPDALRTSISNNTVLLAYDISMTQGFEGDLTVSFPVGIAYNGQQVTILHHTNGKVESYSATVVNGIATITVTSLSIFVVQDLAGPTIPKTGDAGGTSIGLALLFVAVAGAGLWGLKRNMHHV